MTEKVRYGLLSTAQIGLNAHYPASIESEISEIVSVSSRSAKRAKEVANRNNIERWYGSYEEQLADTDVDAIVNCLPNGMHCEWTIKAAETGKHILCEKPLAISVEECVKMIDAAKANQVILVEAFTHRWNSDLIKARRLVSEGVRGKVQTLEAALCFHVKDPKNNVRFSKSLVGGALWDAGCYAVYAMRFVMDTEPEEVVGMYHDSGNWGVDTSFLGILKFKNGAMGHISANMEQPYRCFITIDGSKGRIEIPDMFDDSGPIIIKHGTTREERKEELVASPAPSRFLVQLNEFSECFLTGKNPIYPAEGGLNNTRVLEALYESSKTGKRVLINS